MPTPKDPGAHQRIIHGGRRRTIDLRVPLGPAIPRTCQLQPAAFSTVGFTPGVMPANWHSVESRPAIGPTPSRRIASPVACGSAGWPCSRIAKVDLGVRGAVERHGVHLESRTSRRWPPRPVRSGSAWTCAAFCTIDGLRRGGDAVVEELVVRVLHLLRGARGVGGLPHRLRRLEPLDALVELELLDPLAAELELELLEPPVEVLLPARRRRGLAEEQPAARSAATARVAPVRNERCASRCHGGSRS